MKLTINGKHKNMHAENILSLLQELDINPSLVAVEKNKIIISKEKYLETPLNDGDILEVIRFMGGGL
jgi:sulfur carrier protein